MKNAKKNVFFVLLITIIILFFVFRNDYENIIDNLINANKVYIFIGILLIILYWFLRAVCIFVITKKHNGKITLRQCFKQMIITQFFNGITPFSTGGQPMQIYMLNKSGVKVGSATSIIVQDFIMYQIALVVMGVVALLANQRYHYIKLTSILGNLILVGFIINIVIGSFMVFVSFSKRFNDFIGKLIIKLATKFRFVKDQNKTVEKWEEKLAEFHDNAKLFKENKFLFVRCFIYNLLSLTIYYVIPLFVFLSLDSNLNISIFATIVASSFVLIIGNFVPIPGGSGGIEYGFFKFFGTFVASSLISSSLIIWRFITYYFGMIIGMIFFWLFLKEMKINK